MKTNHTPGPWTTVYLDQNKLDGNQAHTARSKESAETSSDRDTGQGC